MTAASPGFFVHGDDSGVPVSMEFLSAAAPPRFLRRRPPSLPGSLPLCQRIEVPGGGGEIRRPFSVPANTPFPCGRRWAELHGEAAAAAQAPLLLGQARGSWEGEPCIDVTARGPRSLRI
jgi:hypothetical protein